MSITKVQNRINELFEKKKESVLSVYFSAGFPKLNDTSIIIRQLEKSGADLIEIGIPYSDPVADGPTIQESNTEALKNGMSINLLFEQLKDIRNDVKIPLILMGYVNPVIQYGIESFCEKCASVGIDGLIIPDLPMSEYLNTYKSVFEKYGLHNTFLISPQTVESRIREIDDNTDGFIYMVSSASITGARSQITDEQMDYFNRVKAMKLKNPTLIGFGISNKETFDDACKFSYGAIIGSAFIKMLKSSDNIEKDIDNYIQSVIKE